MPETLRPFFHRIVDAFQARDIDYLVGVVQTPTTAYFRDQVLVIESSAVLESILRIYCDNMDARGYARTDCNIKSECIAGPGRMCVEMQCIHYDKAGAVMSAITGHYYCIRGPKRQWSVSLVEYDRVPSAKLAKGLKFS